MLMPVLLLIFAQDLSHRGPTRIQQDVLKLISNITYKSIIYPTNINTCTYLFYSNNELSEIYRDYFVINSTVHSHCTRQKSDLHSSSVQKSIGQKSIQYVGSVLWNEIPQLLKSPMSKYTFERKLKAHLLN